MKLQTAPEWRAANHLYGHSGRAQRDPESVLMFRQSRRTLIDSRHPAFALLAGFAVRVCSPANAVGFIADEAGDAPEW